MSNIINGFSFPRFRVLDANNNLIEELDLRLTTGGLIEEYVDEDIIHTLEKDNEIVKIYNGGKFRINFTLNYENYIKKDNLFKILKVIKYEKVNNYKIFFIPHVDALGRAYRVTYTGEALQLYISKGGDYAVTNKGIIVKWNTKKLEEINWLDTDNQYFFTDSVSI